MSIGIEENYPLRIIKNAAHNANEDNPAEVNAIIKGFLREIGWESLVLTAQAPQEVK